MRKNELSAPMEELAATMMVREGDWKYILYRFDPCRELYNLADDPEEMDNRVHDPGAQPIVQRLHGRMCARLQEDGPGPYAWVLDEGARRRGDATRSI